MDRNGLLGIYRLVNVYITMEKHHLFLGKTHVISGPWLKKFANCKGQRFCDPVIPWADVIAKSCEDAIAKSSTWINDQGVGARIRSIIWISIDVICIFLLQ